MVVVLVLLELPRVFPTLQPLLVPPVPGFLVEEFPRSEDGGGGGEDAAMGDVLA